MILSCSAVVFCIRHVLCKLPIQVARSDYFRRDGPDVHTDAGITLSQAVLGGTVRVQGIYDDIMLKVSPWKVSNRAGCYDQSPYFPAYTFRFFPPNLRRRIFGAA